MPQQSSAVLRNHLTFPRRAPSPARILAGGSAASCGIAGAFAILDSSLNHKATARLDHHLHNLFRKNGTAARRDVVSSTTIIGNPAFVVPAAAALAALIPWTAFSRTFLGVHWASETIVAVALGAARDAGMITFLGAL